MRNASPRPDLSPAREARPAPRAAAWRWAAAAALGYVAAGLLALGCGFRAISDDDYARAVIAQRFALAPRLDPTGTSWLPFPFWSLGASMRAFGPTLEVARLHAIVWAGASGALLWAAGRVAGLSPRAAALGALAPLSAATMTPLAAAHVPELPTAALATFGVVAAGFGRGPALAAGGAALLAASLSRYEAWPLALVSALAVVARPARGRFATRAPDETTAARDGCAPAAWLTLPRISVGERRWRLAGAALAAAGPLLWLGWNRHAHGDALRFARRVAAYHASVARPTLTLADSLGGYPWALVREAPGLVLAAGVALMVVPGLRRRWGWALGAGAVLLLGLSAAEARGGAPTHHPERALLALWCVLGLVVADGGARAWRTRRSAGGGASAVRRRVAAWLPAALGLVAAAGLAWRASSLPETLGPSRASDVELGRALAARVSHGERVLLAPASFGFFAAIAAFGRPDDVTALVPPSVDPRSNDGDPFESAASLARAAERAGARWVLATAAQRPAAEAAGLRGAPLAPGWWLYEAKGAAGAAL